MEPRVIADCPACRGVRTVFFGVCSVCFAEFDEWHDSQDSFEAAVPA